MSAVGGGQGDGETHFGSQGPHAAQANRPSMATPPGTRPRAASFNTHGHSNYGGSHEAVVLHRAGSSTGWAEGYNGGDPAGRQHPMAIAPNVWYYPPDDNAQAGRKSAPPYPDYPLSMQPGVPGVTFSGLDEGMRNRSMTKTPQPVVERHKEVNNFLFGMKKWKGTLTKRPLEERSAVVQDLYAPVATSKDPMKDGSAGSSHISIGNVIYTLLIGWWLAAVYILLGSVLWMTLVAQDYTPLCWDLASYFFWPFGKYVVLLGKEYEPTHPVVTSSENLPLIRQQASPPETPFLSPSPSELGDATPRCKPRSLAFYVWACFCGVLCTVHGLAVFLCGFLVVYIPMAKIQWRVLCGLLWYDPNLIRVETTMPTLRGGSNILMCTFQAANVYYYKYTVEGMNIVFVNAMAFVVLAFFFGYVDSKLLSDESLFGLCCVSIIPLAYYIGMSIANVAAQSNFIIGALLNATFGSIVEIILYYFALKKGLRKMVRASLTGTLLATMLFIPGICMVIGGLKFEQQRFNLRSAGVSSSLLFVSVAGAYSPSLFQHTFGASKLVCVEAETNCATENKNATCRNCYVDNLEDEEMESDPVYQTGTRNLIWFCSALLPLAYIIGLVYTLRTHAHHIIVPAHNDGDDADDDGAEGHGHSQHGPIWSKVKAVLILLSSTVLLALIADTLVETIEPIQKAYGVSEEMMGLLVIALLPDAAEIVNGIQFARQNNIALSIEIGSSIAVQVCMLQIPVLVMINAFILNSESDSSKHFTLIFPDMYVYVVLFSTILMNYTFQDGKSDYFQGSILLITYAIMCSIILFDGKAGR